MTFPLTPIKQHIHRYLDRSGECKEHELINYLMEQGVEPYASLSFANTQQTFQLHFITKHALYLLQQDYAEAGHFTLTIDLTRIQRIPYSMWDSQGISQLDSVRDYYLRLDHFYETSETEVNDMLKAFWERYLAFSDQSQACEILGLEEPTTLPLVKQRYRELAQQHHPDRGGDAETFIAITDAKTCLERILTD